MKTTVQIGIQIEKSRAHGRALLEGIAEYAQEHPEWRLYLLENDWIDNSDYLNKYDGYIVRVMDDKTAQALVKTKKPVIDTYGRYDDAPFSTIRLDDNAIARLAATYLKEHRFSNFAYCGFPSLRFSDARGEAFKNEIEGDPQVRSLYLYNGAANIKDIFFRNERTDHIPDAVPLRRWAKSLPKATAVFCCNDIRALQFLRVCETVGISVPDDLSVLGVDNDKVLCTFSNPPLSSIDTNPFALGQKAAAMLAGLMSKPKAKIPHATLHGYCKVVERTSTEFFPTKTPWLSNALVFIRRHLNDGISAKDVIAHLGYSHTTVSKVFRNEIGSSIQQEIIRLRFEQACRLLKETTRTAADIAAECGYPSAQYFAHLFSAKFHMTPDVWRRKDT
jgi:LacI family transcriptional regulator